MEEQNKIQVFLQCNIATTSQMEWQPPITSTPVVPQIRQSYSVFKEKRIGMLHMANCIKATQLENSSIPSPVAKKTNESILSKSNRTKGKGILVSDSSSDEDEAYKIQDKKLVIKINSEKKNEIEKKKKTGLKINNSDNNVDLKDVKKENSKRVKETLRDLRSNHDLSNVSIRDKENLCGDVKKISEKPKKNVNPVRSKGRNVIKTSAPQKRKCIKDSGEEKKIKIDENIEEENIKEADKTRQLFSEKREEEFLESLDLTAVEVEEPPDNYSLIASIQKKKEKKGKRKKIQVEIKEGEKEDQKKEDEIEKKELKSCSVMSDRPVRNRKPPKKFWLPDKNSDQLGNGLPSTSDSISTPKREKKPIIVKGNLNCLGAEYFKNIKELEYRNNASGYSSAECCSLPKFKCGILRLQSKAHAASKTRGKDSALGGIVLEGSVKMKIGDVEKDIEQGETIFVPPLTEWRAVNLSENESVIYYWCGLF